MKFEIERTKSDFGDDPNLPLRPINGAVLEACTPPYPWKTDRRWVVEVGSLEDLMALAARSRHPLIVRVAPSSKDGNAPPLPSIEIYNGYRE